MSGVRTILYSALFGNIFWKYAGSLRAASERFSLKKDSYGTMANHFSALKRARQTEKRTTHNRSNTSALRTQIRGLREVLAGKDKAAAETKFRETVAVIDK